MEYGEARRFVPPRTGVVCQLPTERFFFDEEVESVGWPVDGYLERIEQAAADLGPHLDRISQRTAAPEPGASPESSAAPLPLAGQIRFGYSSTPE